MFKQAKNIDTAFRHIRSFSILFLYGCICISVYALHLAYSTATKAHQKIFVLANGKALEAFASERKDNILVEAKDHVKVFHEYFFSLDPDESVIESNISKALYLADGSAKLQYDNLKENGYFAGLIAGNISQNIEIDSVLINTNEYPHEFRCVARQRIVRPTTIVTRSLITEGYLRNVSRSENNPHGFLIEKWRTLENKDLNIQRR